MVNELPEGQKGGLSEIYSSYGKLEKQFGELVWSYIGDFFPKGFDISLLKLDRSLSEINMNYSSSGKPISISNISKYNYNGSLNNLYQSIKRLDGFKADGFGIQVSSGFKNKQVSSQQITVKIIKLDNEEDNKKELPIEKEVAGRAMGIVAKMQSVHARVT